MNEQLAQEIAQLEEQSQIFKRDQDATTDEGKKQALQQEIDTVNAKIAMRRQQIGEIQDAVQTAQEELTTALDSIQIGDETISLRAVIEDEAAYQLVYIALQQRIADQTQKYSSDIIALKESYENQISDLKSSAAEIPSLRADNARLQDRNADLESKLDAAANRAFEAEGEVERYMDEVTKLRKQIEDGANKQPTTLDAKGALDRWKAEQKAKEDAKPRIYNVHWKDDRLKRTYVANLATTGEEIEFNNLSLNSYVVVDESEASQFRKEAEQAQENPVPDLPLVSSIEPPPLQPSEGEVPVGLELAESNVGASLAIEALSVEERLARLEKAVFNQ